MQAVIATLETQRATLSDTVLELASAPVRAAGQPVAAFLAAAPRGDSAFRRCSWLHCRGSGQPRPAETLEAQHLLVQILLGGLQPSQVEQLLRQTDGVAALCQRCLYPACAARGADAAPVAAERHRLDCSVRACQRRDGDVRWCEALDVPGSFDASGAP